MHQSYLRQREIAILQDGDDKKKKFTGGLHANRSVEVDGLKLRKTRELLRWTQQVAATKAGYTERLIRKMESGGPISRETLDNVLMAYQEHLNLHMATPDVQKLHTSEFLQCTPKDALEQMSYDWFNRVFNLRDLNAIDEFVHDDVVLMAEGISFVGREAVRQRVAEFLNGFSPLQLTIEQMLTEDNCVVVFWQSDAIHSGVFRDFEATGRATSVRGSTMLRIHNNKFVQARDHWDIKHLIDQIS